MKKTWKNCIFSAIIITLSSGVGCDFEQSNTENERHAFLLGEGVVFIADIPQNWRYVLHPVDDYSYYDSLRDDTYRYVEFMGEGDEGDGEDNFFTLDAFKGKGRQPEELDDYDCDRVCLPFTFRDGMEGEWESCTWVGRPRYGDGGEITFYWGNVYSPRSNCCISLWMLGSEYDTNEQVINDFLASACFRDSDLGVDSGEDLSEREWLTLHIWNKSIRMSLKVPEGLKIAVEDDRCYIYLDENNALGIYPDYGGETLERSGDYYYCLNTEDFEETVYEISDKYRGHNYYFLNQYLLIWNVRKEEVRLQEYVKKIVQSMRFE